MTFKMIDQYDDMRHHGDMMFLRLKDQRAINEARYRQPIHTGRFTVGHGEESGHQHVVENVQVLVDESVTMEMLHNFAMTGEPIPVGHGPGQGPLLLVEEETAVRHLMNGDPNDPTTDHADITLSPGTWVVYRPRELDDDEERRIMD